LLGFSRTYVLNCTSVMPQYSLIPAHVSVSVATCHHVHFEMVSGDAVVGGSVSYALISSGSRARPRVNEATMMCN